MAQTSQHSFKAETQKVLSILTHSLYSNREIFLRELLSNASDALDKLRFLQSKGEKICDDTLPLEIRISVDKLEGTLLISDTGIGMTEKEMIDNLGTIAKSGSEQFLKDMAEKADTEPSSSEPSSTDAQAAQAKPNASAMDGIIGRFGIGFYSVFMVADSVDVISVSAYGDEPPHLWSSTGTGSFTIRPLEGDEAASYRRGTVIRAKLKEDAKEYLEKFRQESAIRRHSNFLPFPMYLEGEQINTTPALWREPKFSITPEQYNNFYTYLTSDATPPLDVIHLSIDAPVQYNSLIFIPNTAQDFLKEQGEEWGLDLYVRRVLIERGNNDLLPRYLGFLKGVVDTEDLPLNISRETLQENVVLRKISQTIVNQVFNHLTKMADADNARYESFWKLHGKYFKFAFNDFLNRDRMAPLMRFNSSASTVASLTSLDQYLSRLKDDQKDIWYVAAPSPEAARVNPHMERFRRKGIEVLYLLEPVDEFALEALGTYKEHSFKSVEQAESTELDAFPNLDAAPDVTAMSDEEKTSLAGLVEKVQEILGARVTGVRISSRLAGSPAVLVSPDGVSSSMEKLIRVMQKDDSAPKKILELNPDHPLLRALLRIFSNNADNPLVVEFVNSLFDNVQLLDGYIADPYLMADRNLKLMDKAISWYADTQE